jgi:type II secretory pathway pseudopilin PulG
MKRSHGLRPFLSDETGVTLIELLLGMAMSVIVFGAITAMLTSASRAENANVQYEWAQEQGRAGLDEMAAEVRQASAILSTTPNSVEFNETRGGVAQHVLFDCDVVQPHTSYQECVRVQGAVGGSLPPLSQGKVVVSFLTNGTATDPVFSFSPDPIAPDFVTLTVKVPASGGHHLGLTNSIVFSDGVLMRNEYVGN